MSIVECRIRLAISAARVGLVKTVERSHPTLPEFVVIFAHGVTPFQVEMVNQAVLKVIAFTAHAMVINVPVEWLPKPEADFEPLDIGPRVVNQHLVAFTCVCSACQAQYDAICTRRFADEAKLADLEAIHRHRCPICEKIETRKTLQPHFSNNVPLNPLPTIVPVPEPPMILLPPAPQPAMPPEVTELVEAARGVLDWYCTMTFSHVGGQHRRLANALIPFEQQPVALEVVK